MTLMTFDSAAEMYDRQATAALFRLHELQAVDCPIPGDIERQRVELARLAKLRDRCRIMAEAASRGKKRRRC